MRIKPKLYATTLVIVAVAMLVFGSVVAAANGKGKKTLILTATENQFEFLDLGATGPSVGDYFAFSETLSHRGREVGASGGVCTVTEVVAPYDVLTFHCVATLSLRRGQITLQGLVEVQGEDDPGPFTVAITGGTGAYRGAAGETVIRDVSPTSSIYKVRLDLPKKHRR